MTSTHAGFIISDDLRGDASWLWDCSIPKNISHPSIMKQDDQRLDILDFPIQGHATAKTYTGQTVYTSHLRIIKKDDQRLAILAFSFQDSSKQTCTVQEIIIHEYKPSSPSRLKRPYKLT